MMGLPLTVLAFASASACRYQPNVDYHGQDGTSHTGLTREQCCALCQSTDGCAVAVYSASYDKPPHACWLKPAAAIAAAPTYKEGVFSCWPNATAPTPAPPPSPPTPPVPCYRARVTSFGSRPVLSHGGGSSPDFAQVFNPSWVEPSAGTGGAQGLLVRTQNCTGCGFNGSCCRCGGTGQAASVLTFARLLGDDGAAESEPRFAPVTRDSVAFGPESAADVRGTEDPRVAYDKATGLYHVLYTCYGASKLKAPVQLCHATTRDPTRADGPNGNSSGWTRHGPLGFGEGSKSGALLISDSDGAGNGNGSGAAAPHMLYWGAGVISITSSHDLYQWEPGVPFITHTAWGNPHVEAGPPPMRLPDGNYLFFHNSWGNEAGYQPAWVVLDGANLTHILARAPEPLWSPQRESWMTGTGSEQCNVPNVAFLEAAHPLLAGPGGNGTAFRVYFGGADAVIGSAIVEVERVAGVACE